jgi:hypothetical protein
MAQRRDLKGGNHSRRIFGVVQTRLSSLVCLAALLALTVLPLVHQCHLNDLEQLHAYHATRGEHQVGLRLSSPEPYKPHHSHHDPATCSICQAASLCRYFSAPSFSLSPILALPVQRFRGIVFTSVIASPDILISGPRAPPTSL